MKRHHWITLAVVVVVGGLLAGALWRIRASGQESRPASDATADSARREAEATAAARAFAADVAVQVRGAPVRRDTFVLWVTGEGEAAPLRSAVLHAGVEGPVLDVPVREGQRVRKGDLLARIDTVEHRLAVTEARAAVEKARAQFRSMVLYDEEIASDSLRRERRRQARVRSGLPEAEARLQRERLRLRRTAVRAPFAGRVANLVVSKGDRVSQGDTLARIVDLSRLDVDVRVLETELPALEEGRRATVRLTAYPGETFRGRVATINPLVSPGSNTARVTVRLGNPRARVLPGMHASVRIAGRLHAGRTFVPREAIVERDRRLVIFVFRPDEPGSPVGRAKWKYVSTGLENQDYVELVPGEGTEMLAPGQVVLVAGHSTLSHDARVLVENYDALGTDGRR